MNLVLIGYRGTGKTTVARRVARELNWESIDSDVEVERRAGKSIAQLFADAGEGAFRDLESAVLADFVTRERIVFATGGGVVGRAENCRLLGQAGLIVWLTARVETILARLDTDATTAGRRPNLLSGGEAEVRKLLAERTPLYESCAAAAIATDDRSPEAVAADVLAVVQARLCAPEGE